MFILVYFIKTCQKLLKSFVNNRKYKTNSQTFLISREQVRDVGCVEDHVDVFHERLLLYLLVAEEEYKGISLSCLLHHRSDVFPPIGERVSPENYFLIITEKRKFESAVHKLRGQLGGPFWENFYFK